MIELSATAYLWIKTLHVISVIAWMAGLLYLPRLFVYHAAAKPGSEHSETLKVMERRLLRAIMNPAMLASLLFGGLMLADRNQALWQQGWMLAKLVLIAAMMGLHMAMSRWRRDFALDRNTRSQLFYRVANEAPTVLMIGVVVLAIAKPF